MQQTAFDRWLKVRFVYRYAVCVNTPPAKRPLTTVVRINEQPARWNYRIECANEDEFDAVSALCRVERIAYTPVVSRKTGWWVRFLDAPDSSSFTYRLVWHFFRLFTIAGLLGWGGLAMVAGWLAKFEGGIWISRLLGIFRSLSSVRVAVALVAMTAHVFGNDDVPEMAGAPDDIIKMPVDDGKGPGRSLTQDTLPATTFRVVKRCGICTSGAMDVPFSSNELLSINIWPDKIELVSGASRVPFEINDAKAMVLDARFPEKGLVPAIKGYRVALGGSIEQIIITDRTVMLIVPSAATNSVMVTYAEAVPIAYSVQK